MSTGYVAPTIDTHDAARIATAVASRVSLDVVIAAAAAFTATVSVLHTVAKALAQSYNVAETAAQKAKGKV